jgi:hypothetical protein
MVDLTFDVRIPQALVDQMMAGEITCAMLTTMTILYKWANWGTGVVRFCSARGLVTASHKAYSERTFQACLQKLEAMGWITRHMVPGSHKDYAVTLHNYKVMDDAGKVQIINPRKLKLSDPTKIGACGETSGETSEEPSDEGSEETSDKVLLNHKPNLLPQHKPDLQPDNDVSVFQSVSLGTDVPQPEDQGKDKPEGLKTESETEEQTQKREQIEALADTIGLREDISMALGMGYFHSGHTADLGRIAAVLYQRNRSDVWLAQLVHWAKGIGNAAKDREGNFWKRKLQTGDAAVAKLAEFLENGTIAEQFDARLHGLKSNCLRTVLGERNCYLLRDGVWLEEYSKSDGYKAFAAKVSSDAGAKASFEPGSMEETMAQNQAKAAAGFEPEEAE